MINDFYAEARPQLRRRAYYLCRNQDTADDLVQEVFLRAVAGGWRDGNFRQFMAWARLAIERAYLDMVDKDNVRAKHRPALGDLYPVGDPEHEIGVIIDLQRAWEKISDIDRALITVAAADANYHPVNKLMSQRLCRGRERLRALMDHTPKKRLATVSMA